MHFFILLPKTLFVYSQNLILLFLYTLIHITKTALRQQPPHHRNAIHFLSHVTAQTSKIWLKFGIKIPLQTPPTLTFPTLSPEKQLPTVTDE